MFESLWLQLQHPNTQWVLTGTLLLGTASGVLGSFVLLRKQSLIGDAMGPFSSAGSVSRFSVHRAKITAFLFAGGSARRTARNVLYSADSSAFKNKGGLGDRDCSFCVFWRRDHSADIYSATGGGKPKRA